ncbi:uncharacterized protein LOC124927309 [Impatiens glandulifera]|uniref:uncharacterized protein LOC124927309 n=1 Tax=Impatiens glandulifera TaxID=253017 RepID=UPI001FB069DF|nr:uncharacterized protein LOC124927309 [Impatiens glandulifera]
MNFNLNQINRLSVAEARNWTEREEAEKRFVEKDYNGASSYALRAQILCPSLEGIREMKATFDVYAASETKFKGETDFYAIFGLKPYVVMARLIRQFTEMYRLLNPYCNKTVGADGDIPTTNGVVVSKSKRKSYSGSSVEVVDTDITIPLEEHPIGNGNKNTRSLHEPSKLGKPSRRKSLDDTCLLINRALSELRKKLPEIRKADAEVAALKKNLANLPQKEAAAAGKSVGEVVVSNKPSWTSISGEEEGINAAEQCFKAKQILALYDEKDAMPRLEKIKRGGCLRIYPRGGDIWAIYKNWSSEWNRETPFEVRHQYEMVEVMMDYDEEDGVCMSPLVKVDGYRTVYGRNPDKGSISWVLKKEKLRFSHRVPSWRIRGGERTDDLPECCWDLDPAATQDGLILQQQQEQEEAEAGKHKCT